MAASYLQVLAQTYSRRSENISKGQSRRAWRVFRQAKSPFSWTRLFILRDAVASGTPFEMPAPTAFCRGRITRTALRSRTSKSSRIGKATYKNCKLESVVMADREVGTVKWFNDAKGYGFIQRDSGPDVFVHYRAIRGEGHRSLVEGQKVEFGDPGPERPASGRRLQGLIRKQKPVARRALSSSASTRQAPLRPAARVFVVQAVRQVISSTPRRRPAASGRRPLRPGFLPAARRAADLHAERGMRGPGAGEVVVPGRAVALQEQAVPLAHRLRQPGDAHRAVLAAGGALRVWPCSCHGPQGPSACSSQAATAACSASFR